MELVQMTAAYSNAVLMLVLSNATDVATKLDLPIIKPVQPSHVWKFVCDPRKDSVGGWLTLTNLYEFWYFNGHVDSMESSHSYFGLQDPDLIPRFFGKMRMSEAEVVEMARQSVRKLGYDPPWLLQKPQVQAARTAPQDKPNIVPHFRVTWKTIDAKGFDTIAEIEINADAKRIEKFWLSGPAFWGKPPNIPQPPVISRPPPGGQPTGPALIPLAAGQLAAATNEVGSQMAEVAKRLGLPIKSPIRSTDIKEANIGFTDGDLRGTILLTNGYRFTYRQGHITSFYSPNSDTREEADPRKIYGKVRYTKDQVREFATKQIRKLGYPDSAVFLDRPPFVGGGPDERNPTYARFRVTWKAPWTTRVDAPDAQFTEAEVNGITLQLESLWLRSTNLFRPSDTQPEVTK